MGFLGANMSGESNDTYQMFYNMAGEWPDKEVGLNSHLGGNLSGALPPGVGSAPGEGLGGGGGGDMGLGPSEEEAFAMLDTWQWQMIQGSELEGQRCMLDFWLSPPPEGKFCNATWDGYRCWGATPPNTTVEQPCPETFGVMNGSAVAHRTCTADGQWQHGTWTNYTNCLFNMVMWWNNEELGFYEDPLTEEQKVWLAKVTSAIYFIASIISFVLLCITLFIFIYFKTLQCNRISIHKNLVVSFIVRSAITVIFYEPFISESEQSYRDVGWLCKLLLSTLYYTVVSNIFWMFVEGLFLHNRVAVHVFNTEAPFRVFYVVGWGSPGVIVLAWAICMQKFNTAHCWNTHFTLPHMWIILVPIIAALGINALFLVNIIRILITKLRANNTVETDQVRKAVKATTILFPLLGLTNISFFFEPTKGSYVAVVSYRITNAVLQASQGIFVSVIYCFMNSEVRIAMLKRWQRYQSQRMGGSGARRRSSGGKSSTVLISQNGASSTQQGNSEAQQPWTSKV